MTIRDGFEYMQLVFRYDAGDPANAPVDQHWEVVAIAPDGAHRAIGVKADGTEIRRWWWDAPHPEISKYLTEYGAEGWQLITENIESDDTSKLIRFVLARPKAAPNRW